jgi:hypothetical protein
LIKYLDDFELSDVVQVYGMDTTFIDVMATDSKLRGYIEGRQYAEAGKRITHIYDMTQQVKGVQEKEENEPRTVASRCIHFLQSAWNRGFTGNTLNVLQKALAKAETDFDSGAHHAKLMAVVQSSEPASRD